MKISGYTLTRNCVDLDYCFNLTINSLLPVCDEVVVSDAESTDGTRQILDDWAKVEPKLRIVNYPWNNPHREITWFTTWINHTRAQLRGDFQLQLDADEVLDSVAYPAVRDAAKAGRCLWFERLNFWRDPQHLAPSGHVCGDQVVRFGSANLWLPSDEPHPEGEPEIRVRAGWPPNGDRTRRIFHYGFLRRQAALIEKVRVVNGAFFGTMDERLTKIEKEGGNWVDAIDMPPLQDFNEAHPEIAHAWLRAHGYTV